MGVRSSQGAGEDDRRRVEHDDVAQWPLLAREKRSGASGVLGRCAATEIGGRGSGNSAGRRVEHQVLHSGFADDPDIGVVGRGQFVQSVAAVHDQTVSAQSLQSTRQDLGPASIRNADHRMVGSSGVDERGRQVEDRRYTEPASSINRVPQTGADRD